MTQEACPPVWAGVATGSLTFALLNLATAALVPASASSSAQQRWKWRNVATSLVHSVITGSWALAAFYQAPYMMSDLQWSHTVSSHSLVCFSIGYFLYDAADMIAHHRKRSTYELLLHHGLVILCYAVAVLSAQFVAFVALSLVVEVNSVFLHARQLLIITGCARRSACYRANALLNAASFLVFRLVLLGGLTAWILGQRHNIGLGFLGVAGLGLGVIDIMNVILFCRILYVDVEAVFPSMVQNNISIEKCSDSPETVNAQKDVQNLDFVGVTEKDLSEEISSEQFSTESFSNNQNFVNGCQKRREWTQESLGD